MSKKTKKNKPNMIVAAVGILVVAIAAFSIIYSQGEDPVEPNQASAASVINENGDLVIPIADITETAAYYAYEELDSEMEVLAVKASDGTIRTAFNTCQVCYSSGRGYYVQEGDVLVCQNCGNRFSMDEVEITRGGCNPVPIFEDQKQVTDESIIIPKTFLEEAEVIFENWKV
jgi:uncharacterized membrane protein